MKAGDTVVMKNHLPVGIQADTPLIVIAIYNTIVKLEPKNGYRGDKPNNLWQRLSFVTAKNNVRKVKENK